MFALTVFEQNHAIEEAYALLNKDQYAMYLRKSRMDTDYEEVSVEETLSRHRQILEKFCKDKKLNVVEILEEVLFLIHMRL